MTERLRKANEREKSGKCKEEGDRLGKGEHPYPIPTHTHTLTWMGVTHLLWHKALRDLDMVSASYSACSRRTAPPKFLQPRTVIPGKAGELRCKTPGWQGAFSAISIARVKVAPWPSSHPRCTSGTGKEGAGHWDICLMYFPC